MRKLGSIELGTKRLLLRRFVVEDAKAMFENWASDRDNLKYVTWDPHTNPQVTQASIERWLLHYQEENTYKWAICKKDDPTQVIGDISVVSQNPQKELCEVGYILGKNFWGQGLMTEALQTVVGRGGIQGNSGQVCQFEPCFGKGYGKSWDAISSYSPKCCCQKRLCRRSNNLHYPFF